MDFYGYKSPRFSGNLYLQLTFYENSEKTNSLFDDIND